VGPWVPVSYARSSGRHARFATADPPPKSGVGPPSPVGSSPPPAIATSCFHGDRARWHFHCLAGMCKPGAMEMTRRKHGAMEMTSCRQHTGVAEPRGILGRANIRVAWWMIGAGMVAAARLSGVRRASPAPHPARPHRGDRAPRAEPPLCAVDATRPLERPRASGRLPGAALRHHRPAESPHARGVLGTRAISPADSGRGSDRRHPAPRGGTLAPSGPGPHGLST
jgi:hypothetical protein